MHFKTLFPSGGLRRWHVLALAAFLAIEPVWAQRAVKEEKPREIPVAAATPLAVSTTASASFLTSMESLNDSHKLLPGDQLSLRIVEEEEPPRTLAIRDSGEMEVPLLGRIKAAGKTCKSL